VPRYRRSVAIPLPPKPPGMCRQPLSVALPVRSAPALHGWSSAGSELRASFISRVVLAGLVIRRFGVMAGMVVSGASPVYAGIYQFVVVAMILAASGITGLVATVLMRSRAFSPAAQLTLRPAEAPASSRQSAPLK